MSEIKQCTPQVLNRVAEILLSDFNTHFKPTFMRAASSINARPIEPEHEAFNALEHLANAVTHAASADHPSALAEQVESDKHAVDMQLGQARKHLTIGRFYCIEHQILATMDDLVARSRTLPKGDPEVRKAQQQRADELESRFRAFPQIDNSQSLVDLNLHVRNLTAILDDLIKLMIEVLGAIDTVPC